VQLGEEIDEIYSYEVTVENGLRDHMKRDHWQDELTICQICNYKVAEQKGARYHIKIEHALRGAVVAIAVVLSSLYRCRPSNYKQISNTSMWLPKSSTMPAFLLQTSQMSCSFFTCSTSL
jgi:hypothetical protein